MKEWKNKSAESFKTYYEKKNRVILKRNGHRFYKKYFDQMRCKVVWKNENQNWEFRFWAKK